MATRYGKGDIVKLKPGRAEAKMLPKGKAKVVKVHDLGKGKKTNYEIDFYDDRIDGTPVISAKDLELVSRGGGPRGGMTRVRAKKYIHEFKGPDGNMQGPISAGDTGVLPTRNAKVLQKRGKVEII